MVTPCCSIFGKMLLHIFHTAFWLIVLSVIHRASRRQKRSLGTSGAEYALIKRLVLHGLPTTNTECHQPRNH